MATLPEARKAPELLLSTGSATLADSGEGALWDVVGTGERAAAAALVLVLFPVLAAAAAVVMALSRRAPLVAHERIGRGGEPFQVLKLRTMWGAGEGEKRRSGIFVERLRTEPVSKKPDDPRVTSAFARFCRRYSIDELPQLWHVVEGRMSLVGPRPMTAQELLDHYGEAAGEVLRVKPGLTGLWQIRGRSRLNYRQRRRLDLLLVRRRSPGLYFRILAATIPRVLAARDAW